MEKYKLALEIFDHPERFSDDELRELLNDKEILEVYNLLAAAETMTATTESKKPVNIVKVRRRRPVWLRAAAVAAIAVTSAAAVAFVIRNSGRGRLPSDVQTIETVVTDGTATALSLQDTLAGKTDSVTQASGSNFVIFKDKTLESILEEISVNYGTKVRFENPRVKDLRLFFKWNKSLTPAQIVAQLNNFDKIDISINGDVITVK